MGFLRSSSGQVFYRSSMCYSLTCFHKNCRLACFGIFKYVNLILKSEALTFPIIHGNWVNPFFSQCTLSLPQKTWENRKVFWCFQCVEKGCIGNKWVNWMWCADMYSELRKTSKMELFKKLFNGWKLLTIFVKPFILELWQCSELVSDLLQINSNLKKPRIIDVKNSLMWHF